MGGNVFREQINAANRKFYEVTDTDFEIPSLNKALYDWGLVYNTIRPHQTLHYLTPNKYLLQNYSINGKEKVYGIH